MTGAFIILGITLLTGVILYITRDMSHYKHNILIEFKEDDMFEEEDEEEVCCGRHAVCEKGLLTSEELYYNDEELDSYKGREPGSYTPEEIEEFREVLYTLRPEEVYQWGVALTQRDIPLPDALRDEWLMLVS